MTPQRHDEPSVERRPTLHLSPEEIRFLADVLARRPLPLAPDRCAGLARQPETAIPHEEA